MTKIEIIYNLNYSVSEYADICIKMDKTTFFSRINDKWSPAENTEHLVLAIDPLIIAFTLPAFLLRILFKTPNRQSHAYAALVEKYHKKLEEGYKASAPYIPKKITTKKEIEMVVKKFSDAHKKLIATFDRWKDADLDKYLLPHPLLGKLTLREMMYFTILHVNHHQHAIKTNLKIAPIYGNE